MGSNLLGQMCSDMPRDCVSAARTPASGKGAPAELAGKLSRTTQKAAERVGLLCATVNVAVHVTNALNTGRIGGDVPGAAFQVSTLNLSKRSLHLRLRMGVRYMQRCGL